MNGPKDPPSNDKALGPVIAPVKPTPPEWKPYKPGIEINSKGELRTVPRD